jgi:adenylate kinase family enzyme
MIKTFVMMGLPGAGKGKQTGLLSEKTGFVAFTTSAGLREVVASGSGAGKKIEEAMKTGTLVPDWLAAYFLEKNLLVLKESEGIIFDGGGRREAEAKLFAEICEWLGRDFRVIHLNVTEETAMERLGKRREIESRHDDHPDIIKDRFKHFNEITVPSLNYFRSIGKVIEIDGEPAPEVVFEEIQSKISSL